MPFCNSLRNFIQIGPPAAEKMTSCRFSRWRISAILDCRDPVMGSLKSPCTTSYRSSIDIIALNCLVFFRKSRFLHFGDRQTDKQMDSTDPLGLINVYTMSRFTIVWSGIHECNEWISRETMTVVLRATQAYELNSTINWSRLVTVHWSELRDVISLQRLCWEIGDKSRSWNNLYTLCITIGSRSNKMFFC